MHKVKDLSFNATAWKKTSINDMDRFGYIECGALYKTKSQTPKSS